MRGSGLRLSLLSAVVAAQSGCAYFKIAPGPTKEGEIVRVASRAPEQARREAVESALSLFFPAEARAAKAARLEAIFARSKDFVARERLKGRNTPLVELRLDRLSAALDKEGLVRPSGYFSGPPRLLMSISEETTAVGIGRAADTLRRALLARGVEAGDARDPLNRERFRPKTPEEAVALARAGGVDWLLLGRADAAVDSAPEGAAWRAAARLQAGLYDASRSSDAALAPIPLVSDASVVDVSSAAAKGRALEEAGENAAERIAAELMRARQGRAELQVFMIGPRDPERARALIARLRRVPQVEGAALGAWKGPEGAIVLRVFAVRLSVDELAARLLRLDPSLTLAGVEPEMRRLTVEAPELPEPPGPWE